MSITRRFLILALGAASAALLSACDGGDREYISIGTAPVGGAFYPIGGAISDTVNESRGGLPWRVAAESTGGSMENIRLLDRGDIQFALSNSSITYFAVRGEEGWDQPYPVRTVMTLMPNVAMFITRAGTGIESMDDLRGRRVYVGPEGAGFEYFIGPILRAHGLSYDDIAPVYGSQQSGVDYLSDGAVAAAFLGGAVPTPSITQAAASMNIVLIPYGEDQKRELIERYPFFEPATIPGGTYRGVEEDYEGLNVGSAHLIAAEHIDHDLVYEFTRLLFENREAAAGRHALLGAIAPETAARDTGTPFHEGAIRYYREAGIWPEDQADADADPLAAQ